MSPFILKKEHKDYLGSFLLIAATVFVVTNLLPVMHGEGKQAKMRAVVASERTEIPLRFVSTVNVGLARIYSNLPAGTDLLQTNKSPVDMSTTGMSNFFKSTSEVLEKSLKTNPDLLSCKTRLIIDYALWNREAHLKRIKTLCHEISESKKPEEKELGALLYNLYVSRDIKSTKLPSYTSLIQSQVPAGWFQDNLKLSLFKAGHDYKRYRAFNKELEEKYWRTFTRGAVAACVGVLAFLAGIIVIFIQLGLLARHELVPDKTDEFSLNLSLKTIFMVFIAWMATQIGFGLILKTLPQGLFHTSGNPVGLAIFTLVTYLINMGPALLYVYLIALKPAGLKFRASLGLASKKKAGLFKQVGTGICAWFAMFPMVMLGAFLASNILGSQGSDNSIVAEIVAAANSSNTTAKILLYLTLAVLAPICEELIFRAFLYASLRKRLGVFVSMIVSSVVFAGIHFDQGGFLMLFAIGFVLSACYERCRNIVPCMIGHGLWNGWSFTLALILFGS